MTQARPDFQPHENAEAWKLRSQLDYEIQLDVKILEGLADKNPSIDGMKLSRFDKVLGLNRERIERVYRGSNGSPLANGAAHAPVATAAGVAQTPELSTS